MKKGLVSVWAAAVFFGGFPTAFAEEPPALLREMTQGVEFTLVDENGQPYTEQSLKGHWTLMYFGFSNCPDTCINMLDNISQVFDGLPPETQQKTELVFTAFDTERDTPEVLKTYTDAFHDKLLGISAAKILGDRVKNAQGFFDGFSIYADRAPPRSDGTWMYNHSSHAYLIGPDGTIVTHYAYMTFDIDAVIADLTARVTHEK
jgi:protein SCO1/2